jgi:hypothetical protein
MTIAKSRADVYSRAAAQVRGPQHPGSSLGSSQLLSPNHRLDPAADERQRADPRPSAAAREGC